MTAEDVYTPSSLLYIARRLSRINYSSTKALVAEWLTNHEGVSVGWWEWQGARNYLFLEEHVKYLQARQIRVAGNGYPDINLTIGGIGGKD